MDLEKNKQRLEILAAELEELKNSGDDLSAYLTKTEARSTYETQTSAAAALALKADVSTTYTKEEVDEKIGYAGSVSYNTYSSTNFIPTDANFVVCEVPYSHITKLNDFILLKIFIPNTCSVVRFTYSQGTTSNTFFYKGSVVNPNSNALETYVVEIGPDNDLENTFIRLIGKYEVNKAT